MTDTFNILDDSKVDQVVWQIAVRFGWGITGALVGLLLTGLGFQLVTLAVSHTRHWRYSPSGPAAGMSLCCAPLTGVLWLFLPPTIAPVTNAVVTILFAIYNTYYASVNASD